MVTRFNPYEKLYPKLETLLDGVSLYIQYTNDEFTLISLHDRQLHHEYYFFFIVFTANFSKGLISSLDRNLHGFTRESIWYAHKRVFFSTLIVLLVVINTGFAHIRPIKAVLILISFLKVDFTAWSVLTAFKNHLRP